VKNYKNTVSGCENLDVIGLYQQRVVLSECSCRSVFIAKMAGRGIKAAKSGGLWPLSMPDEIESGIKGTREMIGN
jgi:hypothetical protein